MSGTLTPIQLEIQNHMKTFLTILAASDPPDLTLLNMVAGILALFFCVAVVVRLGTIAAEAKKQTDHLEWIALSMRRAEKLAQEKACVSQIALKGDELTPCQACREPIIPHSKHCPHCGHPLAAKPKPRGVTILHL